MPRNPRPTSNDGVARRNPAGHQRLRVNADVFVMEFSDQQTSLRNTTLPVLLPPNDIFNAGESSYEGFEFDLSAALTEKLRLDVSYAWIDQQYDSIEDPAITLSVVLMRHRNQAIVSFHPFYLSSLQ